jgi:hypothetical protein
MNNSELINKFYTSFSEGYFKGMIECYHENIVFQDPVFGELKGERAMKMWDMLLSSKTGNSKISFDNIKANSENGNANWTAKYTYGKSKRNVVNEVSAAFKFKMPVGIFTSKFIILVLFPIKWLYAVMARG